MGATERFLVEVERGTEPISGLIQPLDGPDRETRRFSGYIELVAALERTRHDDAETPHPHPGAHRADRRDDQSDRSDLPHQE